RTCASRDASLDMTLMAVTRNTALRLLSSAIRFQTSSPTSMLLRCFAPALLDIDLTGWLEFVREKTWDSTDSALRRIWLFSWRDIRSRMCSSSRAAKLIGRMRANLALHGQDVLKIILLNSCMRRLSSRPREAW